MFEGINQEIMKIAQSITEEQRKLLQSYRNEDVKTVVNASFDFDDKRYEEKGNLNHLIGSITTLDIDFGEFDVVEVPACTWAIFFLVKDHFQLYFKIHGEKFYLNGCHLQIMN